MYSGCGNCRRTSTPRKDSGGSDYSDAVESNPTTLITFNTKKQRSIHKGRSIGVVNIDVLLISYDQ